MFSIMVHTAAACIKQIGLMFIYEIKRYLCGPNCFMRCVCKYTGNTTAGYVYMYAQGSCRSDSLIDLQTYSIRIGQSNRRCLQNMNLAIMYSWYLINIIHIALDIFQISQQAICGGLKIGSNNSDNGVIPLEFFNLKHLIYNQQEAQGP